MTKRILQVKYRSWATLQQDCEKQLSMQGLWLKTAACASLYEPIAVHVVAPDGNVFEMDASVIQVVSGQGMAVQFLPGTEKTLDRLFDLAKQSGSNHAMVENDPLVQEVDPESSDLNQEKKPAGLEPESIRAQIDAMTVAQKRQHALHGNKTVRMLLVRDQNKTIHAFVLKNPGITLDEIEQIARMPSVNPDALRAIANNNDWTKSSSVCRNLVKNPKTPLKEALMLLSKLPISDLRAFAKSGNVRTAIQQAALKKVVQK